MSDPVAPNDPRLAPPIPADLPDSKARAASRRRLGAAVGDVPARYRAPAAVTAEVSR